MARAFVAASPGGLALSLALLLAAGLAEGAGILTLLPVLGIATNATPDTPLNERALSAFRLIGLSPSLGVLLWIVVAGVCLKAALTLMAQRNIGYTVANMTTNLRIELIRSLMQARWLHFIGQPSGRIANAIATEATVTAAAYNAMMTLFSTFFQVVIFCAIALATSWQVTVVGLMAGVTMIGLLQRLVTYARRAGGQNAVLMNSLLTRLSDGLMMIKPLKAMGLESRLIPLLEADAHAINRTQRQLTMASSALNVFQEPVFTVFVALGLYISLSHFDYALPDLLFMAVLFQRIVVRTGGLQVQYQKMVSQEAAYWSLRRLIDSAAAEREDVVCEGVAPTLRSSLQLQNITFAYPSGTRPILDGVSIDIPANAMTALYGLSGTGKTTLADLIIGLLSPDAGNVSVDGVPLNLLDQRKWRHAIGYVPQDLVLFHESVFVNVSLGAPDIRENDVRDALIAAGVWDYVKSLPEGMHTNAGERGARFSGGQRQRIALARALVRKPQLLILDEPTTALDPTTEAAICQTLLELTKTTTIFVISHQPAIVAAAGRTYRLQAGGLATNVTDASHDI